MIRPAIFYMDRVSCRTSHPIVGSRNRSSFLPELTDDVHSSKRRRTDHSNQLVDPTTSDFSSLAKIGALVDKSFALGDFLEPRTPVHLLLRPRRSGKTTLLSMFRDFFEFASPEQAKRKEIFDKLAITKHPAFESEFGKYPVLHLDFSTVNGSTMKGMLQSFKDHIIQDLLPHLNRLGVFRNLAELPEDLQTFYMGVLNNKLPDSQWSRVLFKLTEMLFLLHGTRVVVLIDEYDTPSSYALQHGYSVQADDFLRLLVSKLLKGNKHLRGALLVGILNVAKAGWLSGANTLLVFRLGIDKEYSSSCMFTELEMKTLYERQSGKLPFSFEDLEAWYDGYSSRDGTKLFNPWSVSNAFSSGRLGQWWTKSGDDMVIQNRIAQLLDSDDEFCAHCQTLLDQETIEIETDVGLEYTSMSDMSTKQLLSLMYYAGYLTVESILAEDPLIALVRIPNSEIRTEFRKWIRKDFNSRMTPERRGKSVELFAAMVDGRFSQFANDFGIFLLKGVPQRIFGSIEAAYQNYVYAYFSGAANAVKPKWTTVTMMEVEAGDGRVDMAVHSEDRGTVVEFKCLAQPAKKGYSEAERLRLSEETTAALDQCHTRHYRAKLPKEVKTICEYGIAFLGPYCAIEARLLEWDDEKGWVIKREYKAEDDELRRDKAYRIH